MGTPRVLSSRVRKGKAMITRIAMLTRPRTRRRALPAIAIVTLLISAFLPLSATRFDASQGNGTKPGLDLGKLHLSFEPNVGQASGPARYVARAPGGTIYFSPSGVAVEVQSVEAGQGRVPGNDRGSSTAKTADAKDAGQLESNYKSFESAVVGARPSMLDHESSSTTIRMQFVGSKSTPEMASGEALPGEVNYLIGNDPKQWHSNLPTYAGIEYHSLYPGIDLKYEGTASNLKGTYTLAPGADPAVIRWRYDGTTTAIADADGNLQISYWQSEGSGQDSARVPGNDQGLTLTEQAPVAWQEINGLHKSVTARYVVGNDGMVSFALGAYDCTHALTIDPTLTYSTYFGGIIADQPWGMAMDAQGNSYVVGYTASNNFPTINAYQPVTGGQGDAFIVKFNSNGIPVYSTYLGGNYIDYGNDIAVDGAGNAYVTGWTGSSNFPIVNAFQPGYAGGWDAFVTKISADGSALIYSTYLGGSSEENGDGIAVDTAGNAYVTGDTQSANFPTHNAYQPQHASTGSTDLFVTKFDASGQALVYSTFLGGSFGGETGMSIAADANGYAYITGFTTSGNFPVANAYQPNCYFGAAGCWDAFVTKFSPNGQSLVYSTFLGGNDLELVDKGFAITTDGAGNAYVTGLTGSTNFPVLNAYQSIYGGQVDAFLSKFSSAGALSYSSFLGGNNSDAGGAITLDYLGNIYIGGETISNNFPVVNAIQPTMGGFEDAFVTKFNVGGQSLGYSTYLGGSDDREEYGIVGIGVDSLGTAYMVGSTSARDFPVVNPYQPFNNGSYDLFFAKISDPIGPTATPTTTPAGTATPTPTVCAVSDYSITQSTGAVIVPGTTLVPNSNCNDCIAPMVLPFPVQFYNQTFTQARASSNGNLQFTSDNSLPFNSCLPNATYNNVIYGYWDDLFLDCLAGWGCGIYTSVSGSAPNRIFNIEWRAHRNEPPIVNVKFEIRLYENSNGRFDIIYGQLDNPGDTATVGVQRDTGSRFTQYSCNTSVLSQGLQLTFTLPPCQATTPTSTPVNPTPTNTPVPMPTLAYSTYFGSWERDSIDAIGRDATGNIYVAGTTFDIDFNYGDILVAKFTPDGQTLLWRRLIGGTRIDYGYALAVDAAGDATVAGIVTSFDYPTFNPLQPTHHGGIYDTVLTKLDPQGNTIFSTYLGGSGTDYADGLATDSAGNVYLTGHTESTNFPTTAGAFQTTNHGFYDGFVTKINPNGSAIVWSTYLGGMYSDESHAITLDSGGNVYLTGWTVSPNFPTLNPFQPTLSDNSGDAFVTKMNPSGTGLIYSTYLGGNNPPGPGEDNGRGIVVDAQGYAYITGYTQAANFPTTPGSYQPFFRGYYDAFVTKFAPAGNALVYSTYLGGTVNPPYGDDKAFGIAVDSLGQAVITGNTYSPDFPIVNAVQPTPGGVIDAFVSKFNASGSALVYSTYLGGNYSLPNYTGDDAGTSILIDDSGSAVIGGTTGSYNFPVANAYQPENAGQTDGFIAKITGSGPATTPTASPTASPTSPASSPTSSPTTTRTSVVSATSTATHTTTPSLTPTMPTGTVVASTTTSTPASTSTVTVTATPGACSIRFTDVQPGSTFYTYVECLACQGIISGYSDGTFLPNNPVTRGQAAKIVANAARYSETIPPTRQTFSDVPPNSTFWVYIERVALHGAISGYSDGTFRPFNNVTRGQLSKIDAEVAGYNDNVPSTRQTFSDVSVSNPFWVYIERVALHNVVSGYSDGTFRPNNNVTRGQSSKIVSSTFFPGCTSPPRR
jgi:hypothetical protein